MSSKGIYTALSGAVAQNQRLETIANNIANGNTTAFKKDNQTFREYLTAYEKPPDVINVPRIPASIESFYDMQGGDRGYVDASGSYTSFEQGAMKSTENLTDFALDGSGFFEVGTPDGVRLTRNGSFHVDLDGRLVTAQGFPVLRKGNEGEQGQDRSIKLEGRNFSVTQRGEIFQNGSQVSQLSLVDYANKDVLQKVGNSFYKLKPNYTATSFPAEGRVQQGYLETSNINIIKEMTDMIATTRSFESTQKAIKAFDDMNGRLVNDVPKLR